MSIMVVVALMTCYLRAFAVSKEDSAPASCKGSTFFVDASRRATEKSLRSKRRDVRVILVRHGESMANVKPNLIGGRQNGVSLSAKGREQARLLGVRLRREGLTISEIHSSTAKRASQTAQIAAKEAGFDPARITESGKIVEMSQGGWEQQARSKVYIPENLDRLRANPWEFRPPGTSPDGAHGESHRDIEARLLNYLDANVLPRGSWTPGDEPPVVLVFCHGLLIKAALRGVMGSSPFFTHRLETANTAMTELRYYTIQGDFGGWHVERLNDHIHLQEMKAAEAAKKKK